MTNHPNRSKRVSVTECAAYWIVSNADGCEITRYRKDEIAWHGYTDLAELRREIAADRGIPTRLVQVAD